MKKLIVFACVISLLASGIQVSGACPRADANGDCKVNFEDLAIMASEWLAEGIPDPVCMTFVSIPAGTFQMGDSFGEGWSDELPVHTVTLSSFTMSKYEVTNGQYREYLNSAKTDGLIKVVSNVVYAASDTSNSYPYFDTYACSSHSQIDYSSGNFTVRSKGGRSMVNDPVVEVSWYGSDAFCDYYGYRLPTEAEWEYAARGGHGGWRFPWGSTINHNYANYRANGSAYSYDNSSYTSYTYHPSWDDGDFPYTSPVGRFPANGYGLYDMAGNVWEWCNDWYGSYPSGSQNNSTGPSTGSYRVIRGGSWSDVAYLCRVATRDGFYPYGRYGHLGFRVCLDF